MSTTLQSGKHYASSREARNKGFHWNIYVHMHYRGKMSSVHSLVDLANLTLMDKQYSTLFLCFVTDVLL